MGTWMSSPSASDSNTEGGLPPGWLEQVTTDGKVYFANYEKLCSQYEHPVTGKKKLVQGDLPNGWTRKVSEDGRVSYVDESTQTTTKTDPRLATAEEIKEPPPDVSPSYGKKTTALQVLEGHDLTGKYAIVTGANCGIGYETARSLALHGATVIMACRNLQAANDAKGKIIAECSTAAVEVMCLDLTSFQSVREMADLYRSKDWPLHMLILNAAVYSPPYGKTAEGLETGFQTNHLSHFYLTKLLTDILVRSAPARVVVLSSDSHAFCRMKEDDLTREKLSPNKEKYSGMSSYNISKVCNVLFSGELNMRLAPHRVTSNAVHPGDMINTNIARHWWLSRWIFSLGTVFSKSLQQGAATSVYCAVAEKLEGVGGLYFSNCGPRASSAATTNSKMAAKLWSLSEEWIQELTANPSTPCAS